MIGTGEGATWFCDLSCKTGAACPGGVVPWGPEPCTMTEAEALEAIPPGANTEADYVRSQRGIVPV